MLKKINVLDIVIVFLVITLLFALFAYLLDNATKKSVEIKYVVTVTNSSEEYLKVGDEVEFYDGERFGKISEIFETDGTPSLLIIAESEELSFPDNRSILKIGSHYTARTDRVKIEGEIISANQTDSESEAEQ